MGGLLCTPHLKSVPVLTYGGSRRSDTEGDALGGQKCGRICCRRRTSEERGSWRKRSWGEQPDPNADWQREREKAKTYWSMGGRYTPVAGMDIAVGADRG